MEEFTKHIRTTQVEGGGIYVEAVVPIDNENYKYGQHYSSDPTKPTYAGNIPDAVKRFKEFYYPMYLQDKENN